MRTVERLEVARRAHELTLSIYRATDSFPRNERFGLVAQMRRSAASIGANIAEGDGGNSNHEFARYLEIAKASANEVGYHALLSRDLGYLAGDQYEIIVEELERIRAMLVTLIRRLRQSPRTKSGG